MGFGRQGALGNGFGSLGARLGGAVSITPYLGAVGTRTRFPDQFGVSNKQTMSRTYHYINDDVVALKLVYCNAYLTNGELGPGGTSQVAASIQATLGSRTQVLFSGSAVVTIADNSYVVSDWATVSIARGTKVYIDTWFAGTTAALYNSVYDSAGGEMITFGTSVADTTMSNWTGANSNLTYRPLAILAMTRQGSVLVVGDSRSVGSLTSVSAIAQGNETGEITPSFGGTLGYINVGRFGDSLARFITNGNTIRRAMRVYCTDVIMQLGANDLGAGFSTIQTNTGTVAGYYSDKRVWLTTKPPQTTSTDSFATLANQTVNANDAARLSLNSWVRGSPAGYAGWFEVASTVEDVGSPGKWKVDGTAFKYTPDGAHNSVFGYGLDIGQIPASSFHYP